jgi:prepilin-type N-terminal cleavage/methylation domain-containing protein
MKALRDQAGFTLSEVLVATSLMTVVLGATLSPFEGFFRTTKRNERQNEAQDTARQAVDRLARELRVGTGAPKLIEKAGASDLVFQTVDGQSSPSGSNATNVMRVRYCLDNGRTLWRQTQTWTTVNPPTLPDVSSCPGPSPWSAGVSAVPGVANGASPIFTYDTATLSDIGQINLDLWVDADPTKPPNATKLKSGIVLRNRNKPPVSSFVATDAGDLEVHLDASASYDPEGQRLAYRWCSTSGCDDTTKLGTGVTYDWLAPAAGTYSFYLQVTDSGGITVESGPQTVTVIQEAPVP